MTHPAKNTSASADASLLRRLEELSAAFASAPGLPEYERWTQLLHEARARIAQMAQAQPADGLPAATAEVPTPAPTVEWYHKRCAWYAAELDRRQTTYASVRALMTQAIDAMAYSGPVPWRSETLSTLKERAIWYANGCKGLDDHDAYMRHDIGVDAASDLTDAIEMAEQAEAQLREAKQIVERQAEAIRLRNGTDGFLGVLQERDGLRTKLREAQTKALGKCDGCGHQWSADDAGNPVEDAYCPTCYVASRAPLLALVEQWKVDAAAPSVESPDSELVLQRCADELEATLRRRSAVLSSRGSDPVSSLERIEP